MYLYVLYEISCHSSCIISLYHNARRRYFSTFIRFRSIFIFFSNTSKRDFLEVKTNHKPYEDLRSKCRDWLFIGIGPVHSVFM